MKKGIFTLLLLFIAPVILANEPNQQLPPNMYVLSIGVDCLNKVDENDIMKKDAELFDSIMKDNGIYETKTKIIGGEKATTYNIIKGLDWLSNQNTKNNDISIIFISTHGIDDSNYGFSIGAKNGYLFSKTIIDSISKIKGNVIVIIDACNSGSFIRDAFVKDWDTDQNFIICSCQNDEVGDYFIFEKLLINGLTTKFADYNKDGFIETSELNEYLSKELAKNQREGKPQHTTSKKGKSVKLTKI